MKPLVSIITPTFGRERFLPQALRCVQSQTYPNIEWLVLDDSPEPTRALETAVDGRIRYRHSPQRLTIGEKRNRLVAQAQGELIAHFDDDDYYAPTYLETMVANLAKAEADFANLCSWYLYDLRHDLFGFWYLRQTTGLHYLCYADGVRVAQFNAQNNTSLLNNYLGYGFTYVYKRTLWEAAPFPDRDWGEDLEFVRAAAAHFQLLSMQDQTALVLHLLHAGSSSSCFPQYRLPTFLADSLFAPYRTFLASLRPADSASAAATSR